jgi:hypothetical protein
MQGRLLLYFKHPKPKDRWFYGDRYIRSFFKKLFKKRKIDSLERVFLNLCKGLDLLNVKYKKNLPFSQIEPNDKIIVLGAGKHVLDNYKQSNKIIAGIGLMTHPNEWPTLFEDYPIKFYLQHSEWTTAIYNKWYGPGRCKTWPVGIDTTYWKPNNTIEKKSLLVYVKFLWNKELQLETLLKPLIAFLEHNAVTYQILTYGNYDIEGYKAQLNSSKAMIFLCEHESQGLACQEAMAMDVPIFAWNQGLWLDQNLTVWGEHQPIAASAVPYFDESCGDTFKSIEEFQQRFPNFWINVQTSSFSPRSYILNHLSLEKSAKRMMEIVEEVYS